MLKSKPHKFWLVSAIDDDPVKCQSFESAADTCVGIRELIEGNESRHVYAFTFYGDRVPITKGPERYLIVPHHAPSHYALFTRSGENADVDDHDGQLCAGPPRGTDVGYQKVTDGEQPAPEDEPEVLDEHPDDNLLTEPEEIDAEH